MFSRIYTGVSHATITIYPHVRVILNIESSLTNSRHSLHRRSRDETRVSPPTFFWRGIKPLRQPQHRASSKSRNRPTRFFFLYHTFTQHTRARGAPYFASINHAFPERRSRIDKTRESKNVRTLTRTTSQLRLIVFAESKYITVSGKRNIPTSLTVRRLAIIPGRTLCTVTTHPSTLERQQRWGWAKLSPPRLFANVIFTRYRYTRTHVYIRARGKCTARWYL